MRLVEIYNKKARFEYEILESFEAGIVLTGLEIKALRAGKASLSGAYAKVMNGEVYLLGGNFEIAGEKDRTKKLLLHKEEINRLIGKTQESGLALVPLKMYLKRGFAKVELGIGRGLKKYDQREKLKEKDREREAGRTLKNF